MATYVRLVLVVSLVPADLRLVDAALVGDDALREALGHDVAAGWASLTEVLIPTRDALAARPEDAVWGARFFVDGDPPELVGWAVSRDRRLRTCLGALPRCPATTGSGIRRMSALV